MPGNSNLACKAVKKKDLLAAPNWFLNKNLKLQVKKVAQGTQKEINNKNYNYSLKGTCRGNQTNLNLPHPEAWTGDCVDVVWI